MNTVKCFVLMAYGKSDKEKKESINTYKYFFHPICKSLGFSDDQIDRADISGETAASLARNYFSKISTAELVIADLQGNSPSVYYEIGVRHSLHKKRTIIFAPTADTDGHEFKVAFDVVNDHNITRYNSARDIDTMESEATRISELAKKWMISNETDSPVFHHIPDLLNYQERSEPQELQSEIDKLKSELDAIKAINNEYQEKLINFNLLDHANAYQDILKDHIDFDDAEHEQELYGTEIIQRLRASKNMSEQEKNQMQDNDDSTAKFKQELLKINDSDFIDAYNFRRIASLCEQRKLPAYQRRVLEVALHRYKDNDDIRFELIDVYHESESFQLKQKAVQMCENYFEIEVLQDGQAVFTDKSSRKPITFEKLVSLFNSYIGCDYYNRLSSITDSATKMLKIDDPRISALLPRNKAVAEMEYGRFKEATASFKEAYTLNPKEQTISLLAKTCYSCGQLAVGYMLREFLVIKNPDSSENYIKLIGDILKYRYIRIGNDNLKSSFATIGLNSKNYEKYIIPILYLAMVADDCDEDDCRNIRSLLNGFKTKDSKEALDFFNENEMSQWASSNFKKINETLKDNLDFTIVDYIESQIGLMEDSDNIDKRIDEVLDMISGDD